jgi:hypothetical protein
MTGDRSNLTQKPRQAGRIGCKGAIELLSPAQRRSLRISATFFANTQPDAQSGPW